MGAKNYRDLIAWKKGIELALAIYQETAGFPPEEKYGLQHQLRKAGNSVPSNIAEGQGRRSSAEFHHFLSIAHGSIREIETEIEIATALGYMKKPSYDRIIRMTSEEGRLVTGLMKITS